MDSQLTEEKPEIVLDNPDLFFNRELSILRFQSRVLDLAKCETIPLLNRLMFLCITSSNLDEFFEVRVAGLKRQQLLGLFSTGSDHADQLSPSAQLKEIREYSQGLVDEQYRVLNEVLIPALANEEIHISRRSEWSDEQRDWVKSFFETELYPILSPLGLDPAHPFPRVLNKSLNFIVSLEGKDAFGRSSKLAIVGAPRALPRIIRIPENIKRYHDEFIFLSSVIHENVEPLFPGMNVTGCYQFRLTRNSDLFLDEEDVEDLLHAVEGELFSRRYGDSVRLEIAADCPDELVNFLADEFRLGPDDIYRVKGPVNLMRLNSILDMVHRPDLEYPPHTPRAPKQLGRNKNIFDVLSRQDILLHLPFETFSPVIDMVQQAANDPNVVGVKMTLYRAGSKSVLVDLLIEAARNGKEVTAIVELLARFDEEANIKLANRMQAAGVQVVYGVVGYKTHAKMLLIVRRESDTLKYYTHLGTGNYHVKTSRLYTDLGLMTSNQTIGRDVQQLFLQLTGVSRKKSLSSLLQSPFTLLPSLLKFIEQEADNARKGKPARIIAKVNSVTHRDVIKALYEASQAGVQIDLIVRGICCLKPGIEGISENITVKSIVGRFLEHTRIYYFLNDGKEDVWLGSADWMERNLVSRVETSFPVNDKKLKKRVIEEGLYAYIDDNTQSYQLLSDGNYEKNTPAEGETPVAAQERLLELFKS